LPPGAHHDYGGDTTHVSTGRLVHYQDELDQTKPWTNQDGGAPSPHPQTHVRYHPPQHHTLHVPPAVIGDELTDSSPFQTPSDSDLETDSDETLASRGIVAQRVPSHLSLMSHASTSSPTLGAVPSPASRKFPLRPRHLHPLAILAFLRRTIPTPPPPLLASLAALVCTIPALQTLLNSSAMVPVRGALESAGGCSVPLTLIVLGGWFWEDDGSSGKGKSGEQNADADGKRNGGKSVPRVVVSGAGEADADVNGSASVSRRRSLTQEGLDEEATRSRGPGHAQGNGVDVSRSPSLTSLFSVLHGILKMQPVKRRQKGAIHLPDDEDIEQGRGQGGNMDGDVDTEAEEGHSSSASSLRARKKLKQAATPDEDIDSIGGTDEPTQKANQPPQGETLTVILTLVARMLIVPLLVLPLIAYIKVQSQGDEGAIQVFDE